jgi:integrase
MPKVTLTDLSVRALKAPASGQQTYWDKALPGFGVRVSLGGTKTYILVHGLRRSRTTIGRVGVVGLSAARKRARELLAAKTLGVVPEATALTLPDALQAFLHTYRAKNKKSTALETERLLRRHLTLKKVVSQLTTADITNLVDRIPAKSEAQHFFVAARTLCNWLVKRRHIPSSPMAGLDLPYRSRSRDRVLSDRELAIVWKAAEGDYRDLIRLLILTGQRIGQFTNLRGSFIDRAQHLISWPAEAMKGNRAHTVPYGDMAADIIEQRFVDGLLFSGERNADKPFTNFSNSQKRLSQKTALPHWTAHDIRRSVTTQWAGPLGIPPFLCEVMLAHKGGEVSGVHAIYNRWNYEPQLRQLVERWEARLAALIGPA